MCPIVFSIGAFEISGYWLMTVLGLLATYTYLFTANRRKGQNALRRYHLNNLCCLSILSIYIGGALMGALVKLPEVIRNADSFKEGLLLIFDFALSNRAFYGGIIMLLITFIIYCRHFKLNGEAVTELFMPATALFMIFGRLGCFMGGCCYGKEVSWGIIFPQGSLAPAGVPLFPSQLAEALCHLIIFAVLTAIATRLKNKYRLIGIYGIFYGTARFILEFWRGDADRGKFGTLYISQYISIALILVSLIFIYIQIRREIYEKRKS